MFTYDDGFIKRGLVGTIALSAYGSVSKQTLIVIHYTIAALASTVFAALVFAVISNGVSVTLERSRNPIWTTSLLVGVALLTSPGVIQQLYYDPGRFDAIGLIFLCFLFACIFNGSKFSSLIALLVISSISIFIHEAFYFWIVPMGLGFFLWRHGTGAKEIAAVVLSFLVLSVLTALTAGYDYENVFAFDVAMAELQNRADFPIREESVMVHYRDISKNLEYTLNSAWSSERLEGQAKGLVFLSALLLINLSILRAAGSSISRSCVPLLILSFGPLMLLLVGHDHGRWIAMVNCNLVLIAMTILREHTDFCRRFPWQTTLVCALVIFFAYRPWPRGRIQSVSKINSVKLIAVMPGQLISLRQILLFVQREWAMRRNVR